MLKISKLINLFKEESCKNKVEYEFYFKECYQNAPKEDTFYSLTIYYYTNLWSIEHNEPNELEIVLDHELKIMGIEFESAGDRVSRTPAWKRLCKAVAEDEEFEIDVAEKVD